MKLLDEQHYRTHVKASELSAWLLSQGISAITTYDAAELLGVPPDQVRQRLAAPKSKGYFVTPARGLWVPVPAERMTWGGPEPATYLDEMMRFFGASYYVGWLTAASLHGASHQAPQVFQVAVDRHVANREVGRTRFAFYSRSSVEVVRKERLFTSSGSFFASTSGVTMLDVMRDVEIAGGLDNAATVVLELAESDKLFMPDVLACALFYPDAAVRRLGWVLDNIANMSNLDALERLSQGSTEHPSLLSPVDTRAGCIDERWHIVVNRKVEPDV